MRAGAFLAVLIMGAGAVLAAGDPFAFMPDGGRGDFPRVFPDAATQAWAMAQDLTPEDWQAEIATRAPDLGDRETRTLAAYLAAVAPLERAADDPLPPDGRDIALAQCQSCHSLFSGYLMQRRDRAAWLSTFASPFHSVIDLTDGEKAIFADYSALNMPMRFEDVPPELRF